MLEMRRKVFFFYSSFSSLTITTMLPFDTAAVELTHHRVTILRYAARKARKIYAVQGVSRP